MLAVFSFGITVAQSNVEDGLKGVAIYDLKDLGGSSASIGAETTETDGNISNGLNNKVSSLRIGRGWKVIIADNANGSNSTIYEARNNETVVNLPSTYDNKVSYINVQKLWGGSIYSGSNQTGTKHQLKEGIYSGDNIPGGLNNSFLSIKVHKGFMMTIAENDNGSGQSRNYIARTEDFNVNIPIGSPSFIRILPWRDVKKKGLAGKAINNDNVNVGNKVGASWYYNWGQNLQSQFNYEYVPLRDWNWDNTWVTNIRNIPFVTHLNLFNEPDNSNQDNPRTPAQAADQHIYPLQTGLRIGSPACEENWKDWMCEYFNKVNADNNKRIDYVNLHWYDWGGYSSGANSSAQAIGDRFLAYIDKAHDETGLPIWITEFNANPNRNETTQKDFLNYVLPKLESRSHVERYSYFLCPNNCQFLDSSGNLTAVGQAYKDASSSLSIPDAKWQTPISSVNCKNYSARGGSIKNKKIEAASLTEENSLSIYPNPVTDVLNIKGLSKEVKIHVYGLTGQLLLTGYGRKIDVSKLKTGTYIIKSDENSFIFSKK